MKITAWDCFKVILGLGIQHIICFYLIPDWYNHQLFSTEILTRSQYMIMTLSLGPMLFGAWITTTLYIELPYLYIKKRLVKKHE